MPYGITQCYLLPDTSERTPPSRLHPSQTGCYSIYRPFKDGGLSKPRPRVQRATGPRLLRDNLRLARPEPNPQPSDRKSSTLTTRPSLNETSYPLILSYYITEKVAEQVNRNRKCHVVTRFYNFQPSTPIINAQN